MILSKLGYTLILEYLSLAGNVFYDMDYALFELGKIVGDRLNISILDAYANLWFLYDCVGSSRRGVIL